MCKLSVYQQLQNTQVQFKSFIYPGHQKYQKTNESKENASKEKLENVIIIYVRVYVVSLSLLVPRM